MAEREPLLPQGGGRRRGRDDSRGVTSNGVSGMTAGILVLVAIATIAAIIAAVSGIVAAVRAGEGPPMKLCGSIQIPAADACYDVVVVGGGSAGSRVARSVSDDFSISVLLLEAGPDAYNQRVAEPAFNTGGCASADYENGAPIRQTCLDPWAGNGPSLFGYHDLTIPQPGLRGQSEVLDAGRLDITTGRVLGGGSSINGQQYVLGTEQYWNDVQTLAGGVPEWSSANVFAAYKKMEKFNPAGFWTPGATRSQDGDWAVTVRPINASTDLDNYLNAIVGGYANIGAPFMPTVPIDDYNDPATPVGWFARWQLIQKWDEGTFDRETTDQAFLNASILNRDTYTGVGRRQLTVSLSSTAQKLLWHPSDATRCVGVQYLETKQDGSLAVLRNVWARHDVVLTMGFQSAAMLQRNGIGPASVLSNANVPVRVLNEHVGEHFQHHLACGIIFPTFVGKPDVPPFQVDEVQGNQFRVTPGGWTPDAGSGSARRAFQWITLVFPFDISEDFLQPPGTVFLSGIAPLHVTPVSEGYIRVQSADPNRMPLYTLNSAVAQEDQEAWQRNLQQFQEAMVGTGNFVDLAMFGVNITDPASVTQFVLDFYLYSHHWSGATRIGTDSSTGAVNARLQVFGTTGLRVADTSALPKIPDANTMAPAVLVAEVCSQFIKEDILASASK